MKIFESANKNYLTELQNAMVILLDAERCNYFQKSAIPR